MATTANQSAHSYQPHLTIREYSVPPGREWVPSLAGWSLLQIGGGMGYWLQGQFILMLIVFLIDYIGLLIIGVPYALILALIAGLLEIVPYIGPIISAVLAFAITFLHDPVTGFVVLALFALVQQLEGYVIAPLVMKKAVGLNPVVVILALMIGAKLAGVTGIIIAVPVATAIGEVVNDLTKKDTGALDLEKNKQG